MSPRSERILGTAWWLGLLALLSLPQLCFWQAATDPFAPVELALVKLLVPLCLLPWLWRAHLPWRELLRRWPARLLVAWMLWLWVAALISPSLGGGSKTAMEYDLYAALFFLPAALHAHQRRQALAAFTGASLLAAGYGVAQHLGADPWHWSTDFGGRPLGTIGNPDFFAGHLVLAWGLCLGWLLASRPGRRRGPALAFGLLSWVQAYSRVAGAWLGMLAAAAVAAALLLAPQGAWLRARWGVTRQALSLGLAGLLLAGALGLSVGPGHRVWQQFRQEKALSVVNRTLMWRVAVDLWRPHPVQGAGLDSYRSLYPELQAKILTAEPHRGWNYVVTWLPHQNYLYLLCETGAVGLLLFLGLWALAAARAWAQAGQGDSTALAGLLALAGLAGAGLLNTFSNIPPTALGSFFLLGLLVWRPRDAGATTRPLTTEILVGSLVLTLLLAIPAGRELAANRLTREAGRSDKRGDFAMEAAYDRWAAGLGVARLSPQSLVGVQYSLGEALRQLSQQQTDPQRGLALLQQAVNAYQADLSEGPWAPETHNMLGAAQGQLGSQLHSLDLLQQSAWHLETAARLSPGYTSALLNLGGSRMLLGNTSGAAQAWQEALAAEPDNAQAKAYLAGLRRR